MANNPDQELIFHGEHLRHKISQEDNLSRYRTFRIFLEELANRVKIRGKDVMVAVTGERGMGKSNFGLCSSLILNLDPFNIYFDMKDHLCPSAENLADVVENASVNSESSYLIDEAIDVADSRGAMTKINRALTSFAVRARKKRNIYFWCIPDFLDIDSRLRNKVIHLWVHIYWQSDYKERNKQFAMAAVFRKDLNPFNPDKWGFSQLAYQKKTIHDPQDLLRLFKRVKSFSGTLAFPIIPEAIEDKYIGLSVKALEHSGKEFQKVFGKKKEEPVPAFVPPE